MRGTIPEVARVQELPAGVGPATATHSLSCGTCSGGISSGGASSCSTSFGGSSDARETGCTSYGGTASCRGSVDGNTGALVSGILRRRVTGDSRGAFLRLAVLRAAGLRDVVFRGAVLRVTVLRVAVLRAPVQRVAVLRAAVLRAAVRHVVASVRWSFWLPSYALPTGVLTSQPRPSGLRFYELRFLRIRCFPVSGPAGRCFARGCFTDCGPARSCVSSRSPIVICGRVGSRSVADSGYPTIDHVKACEPKPSWCRCAPACAVIISSLPIAT